MMLLGNLTVAMACNCAAAIVESKRDADARKRAEEQRRLEDAHRQYAKRIGESGIPTRFLVGTLSNFETIGEENAKALQLASDYVRNFAAHHKAGKGLFLVGDVGRGKTRLATTIGLEIMREKHTCRYVTIAGLFDKLRKTYALHGGNNESEIMQELSNYSLLIIDDFGKEVPTEWAESKIFQIINDRYERSRPLIITTNLGVADIENRYPWSGAAIVSRLFEMTKGVLLTGADRRMSAQP